MTLANPDKKNDAADIISSTNPSDMSIISDPSSAGSGRTSPGPKTRAPESKRQPPYWMILAAVLVILISLSLIIGLSIGLTRATSPRTAAVVNNNNENIFGVPTVGPNTGGLRPPPPAPTPAPTWDPDQVALRRQQGMQFLLDGNFAKAVDLNDSSTPQARALEFVLLGNAIPTIPTLASSEAEQGIFLDRWVAMVLYYSTGGDSWTRRWNVANSDQSVCQWNGFIPLRGQRLTGGFFCGREGNRVRAFQFGNSNVTGTLPTELGLLTDLAILSLPINNIIGTIPSELQNCRQMRALELSYNQLEDRLPIWIGGWSELWILGLSNNMIEESIPDGFRSLENLVSLTLDDNLLTGTLDNLNPLMNLQEVLLEDNAFTGDLSPLRSLEQLSFLDASNNKLEGDIPDFLLNHENLTVLDLHGNMLAGELPSNIGSNDVLRILALQQNDGFTGELPPSMTNLGALTHLDLTSTSFTGDMPTFLGDLFNLTYLFMADVAFDEGPIPDEYQRLTMLRDLSLKDSNRIGIIPTWMGGLDNLVLLDLDANRLTGTIPTEIGDMESLHLLLLNRNELRGTIPPEISNLANTLVAAYFDHNQLTGNATGACDGLNRTRTMVISDCNETGSGPNDFVVICPCCQLCCVSSDEDCNDGDNLAQFDPIWENGYQRRGAYDFTQDYNITRI